MRGLVEAILLGRTSHPQVECVFGLGYLLSSIMSTAHDGEAKGQVGRVIIV